MTTEGRPGPSQPRSIRCPEHGFFYDPDQAHGCWKCLEEQTEPVAAAAETPSAPRFSRVTVLFWLVAAGGLGYGGFRFFQSMGERGGNIQAEVERTASRIDPELVRTQIQAVEALVYPRGATSIGHGARLQRAIMVLFRGVMGRAPRLLATHHGGKIVGFGNVATDADDGAGTIDMARIQREWERVRAEAFFDADWFRR